MKKVQSTLEPSTAFSISIAALFLLLPALEPAWAGTATWTGAGADGKWQNPANWSSPPASGDGLIFTGTRRLNNTNFTAGFTVNGISFNSPAAAFNLFGSSISLTNDIVDNQASVNQTITLPLTLDATHAFSVVSNGTLTVGGVISGPAGVGIVKTGEGTLTLGASNTFSGSVIIDNGTVSISSDGNLGALPASPTAGKVVINGTLFATTNVSIHPNRGLTLGDASGTNSGTIKVLFNSSSGNNGRVNLNNYTVTPYTGATTVTNREVIANNTAGTNGLTKRGFGGVTLAATNTYTGPTAVRVGTLRLDFTDANAPTNNIVNTNSALVIGGDNNGAGSQSFAAVVMTGRNGATNSQSFNGTSNDVGAAYVRVNSGTAGAANLRLGALTHRIGAHSVFILPTNGVINTSATNIAGILGGWATVATNATALQNSTIIPPNTFAKVDGSGNIGPYTGYAVYSAADDGANVNLNSAAFTNQNVLINGTPAHAVMAAQVDTPGAGTLTDINTISFLGANANGDTVFIGTNNTLRLGRVGAIFRQDINNAFNAYIGGVSDAPQTGSGIAGSQGIGTLTAGGADNTPGEIVFIVNNNAANQNTGRLIVEANITDNGTGVVTVVKSGLMGIKLDGHNSYSGGTYVLQSYLQIAGTETGTQNQDGVGSGPVYIFPGAQFFASGAVYTNEFFFAGIGTDQENFGAVRGTTGTTFAKKTTLIGDARLAARGASGAGMIFPAQITDNNQGFAVTFGDGGATGNTTLSNTTANANDWAGDTIVGFGVLILGADEQIPDGLGKGNVALNSSGTAGNLSVFNLNGHNETINGLTTIGNAVNNNIFVDNQSGAATATLILGNIDASATFRGILRDNGGVLALTKIGGGTETLTGANTYSGNTLVAGGTLAVTGSGTLGNTTLIEVTGTNGLATLDVSGIGNFSTGGSVGLTNGALTVNTATMNSLALTNSRVQAFLDPAKINVTVSANNAFTVDGTTNFIDLPGILNVSAYPTQFTVIKYSGAIQGAGFNFALGNVPTANTVGYVSNNVANSSVDVYLLNGPKQLLWTARFSSDWDLGLTKNWTFGASDSFYSDLDSPLFDDSASNTVVNLTTVLTPASVVFNNVASNYTVSGPGKITGFTGLNKSGAGTVTLANTGVDDYTGGISVNAGTLIIAATNSIQNGMTINNATVKLASGNLPFGAINNEGALVFDGSGDLAVSTFIIGDSAGVVIKTNANSVTLSGASTYDGQTLVNQGTLVAGSGGAANGASGPFGSGVGATIITNNATLDVGGQNLGVEPILVAGSGVGGNGAIVNSGAAQQNALINVTLANDAAFGGTTRWDIRGTGAALSTGGIACNLTKVGSNQVSLASVNVDGSLSNIFVQGGIFSVEGGSTLGEATTSALTVSPGATFQLFNTTVPFGKPLVLNGNGVNNTLNSTGINDLSAKTILNSGNCVFNVAGTNLTINNDGAGDPLGGAGGLTKNGAGDLYINIPLTFAGPTLVNNGQLVVDAPELGSSSVTVAGGTLAGNGWFLSPVTIQSAGTLSPGDTNTAPIFTLVISNALTLGGTCAMDVDKTAGFITSDLITNVTTLTLGGTLSLNITGDTSLTNGDSIHLFGFTTAGGGFSSILPPTPGPGMAWDQSHLATDGTLRVGSPPPIITGFGLSGSNVIISGTNGTPNGQYLILTSTNIVLPLTNWTAITTQNFDANGGFTYTVTNGVNTNTIQQFYLLSQ